MKKSAGFICLALFALAGIAQEKDTVAIRFSKFVTGEEMQKNLTVLASDEYEGRETGMKGQKMAMEYIAGFYKSCGIPECKNTYYQQYNVVIHKPQEVAVKVKKSSFKQGEDFYSPSSSSKDSVYKTDKIVFAGYGINARTYNDYSGLNLSGKTVLILDGEPMDKENNSVITQSRELSDWSAIWKMKLNEAKAQGISVLLIADPNLKKNMSENSHRITSTRMNLEEDFKPGGITEGPLVIYVSETMANQILKGSKKNIQTIKNKIKETKMPVSFDFSGKMEVKVKQNHEKLSAENVLAYIEGSDLKDELVIVTAHYDHLGKHDGVVYNGADDDGSGTVGVMQLAKAFAEAKKQGKGPRRSMLFMNVSGEEKGLLGSDYYSRHPVFPLAGTVADLNIDMIGRLDEKHKDNANYVYIIGSNMLSPALHEINDKSNKIYTNLELDYTYNTKTDPNRYYYRSDHYNFAKNNIPVIFYFNGVHADYHKETDEVQKIDFNKMEKIARLVFFTAWELANRTQRITVQK